MLLPALMAFAQGELTEEHLEWLRDVLPLEGGPRTEGYGAANSIAHSVLTDDTGDLLLLDLGRVGRDEWVFALYAEGAPPYPGAVEKHRELFREVIEHVRLKLIAITPASTEEGVFIPAYPPEAWENELRESAWNLPYNCLEQMWVHLGLDEDAPRVLKEIELRAAMATPVWLTAPIQLRREAEEFLREE